MIINIDREPKYSLYYIGGIIIEILRNCNNVTIEKLHNEVKKIVDESLNIDFLYYSLDWLYILSLINIDEDKVILC